MKLTALRPLLAAFALSIACTPVSAISPAVASAPAREASPLGSLVRTRAVSLGFQALMARDDLRLDARPPAGASAVRYSLAKTGGGPARQVLHGGIDAAVPAVFDAVEPGVYTACARIELPGAAGTERCETVTVEAGGARLIALDA